MNTATFSTLPRTGLLDEEWIVAVQDAIDSQLEHISEVIEPELMGRYDAEMKIEARPLEFYAKLGDIEAYYIGYKEAVALLAETEEYEDDMLDRQDWARGGW